jgi:hypothetical protein
MDRDHQGQWSETERQWVLSDNRGYVQEPKSSYFLLVVCM